ncbi:MAG: bifunctional [glutamine synthetase] adenylyltransferase/[glutamine synthetase]-adenylyl-L-tyrosine phosphorylase, partial [Caulobacterales bacterium]
MPELKPVTAAIASKPLSGSFGAARAAASEHAPYLERLMRRREDLLAEIGEQWPQRLLDQAMTQAAAIAAEPPQLEEGMRLLRRAKDAVHLGLAMADLARAWPLEKITQSLSDFADASLQASLALASRQLIERGDLQISAGARGPVPGMALIAMGKMGAGELNYSSDIDFSVFYDPDILPISERREPSVVAVRLVAPLVRALEEINADGYVFRTDLRLRPDPGATPTAVSLRSAENYYQHLGQNWERAAFIKARAAGGDFALGAEFLKSLEPFIWRKNLDFAAIDDIQSIKRQIITFHKSAELSTAVFDVKLGRGGIRDIELFAQTQQLILGGRNKGLRDPTTIGALKALAEHGAITGAQRDALTEAYRFYRDVEHRLQMMEDAQTQRVPASEEQRAHLAALCGFDDLAAFEHAIIARRAIVAEIDYSLFGGGESLADPLGSLVFTGVEDDPDTLATIEKLGFSDPKFVSQTIRGWHHGRVRAMRAERARELLTALTPKLLRALADSGEPDQAFIRFADFFSGLVAGVQVLSLLTAHPELLAALARAFGLAPRLSEALSRRPALMDAMIERRFTRPLQEDEKGERESDLRARVQAESGFEGALNVARRFQREEMFRIGMQVLDGKASAESAGAAYADLAEACVRVLADAALQETERRFGKAPGRFAVLALGKFGGRELADGSDLDIMIVYDAEDASDFYTRFTQRLVSALSAPTEEGLLYDVDMQLRPSGSAGPVAVRLSSFERYYAQEAWTWELLALTRLRCVAGDQALCAEIEALKKRVI